MGAAPEVMPPVSLFCPTTSEVDVGGMAAEAEPSHQHSIIFCCRVTDSSRGVMNHRIRELQELGGISRDH